jgi:SnoaL-like domain
MTDPSWVVHAFVEAIDEHDVAALAALMTDDLTSVAATGTAFAGRDAMTDGWRGYFSWFPDYRIEPATSFADGPTVARFGRARGTFAVDGVPQADRSWNLPAPSSRSFATVSSDSHPVRRNNVPSSLEKTSVHPAPG